MPDGFICFSRELSISPVILKDTRHSSSGCIVNVPEKLSFKNLLSLISLLDSHFTAYFHLQVTRNNFFYSLDVIILNEIRVTYLIRYAKLAKNFVNKQIWPPLVYVSRSNNFLLARLMNSSVILYSQVDSL